jgi:hypothetical protein
MNHADAQPERFTMGPILGGMFVAPVVGAGVGLALALAAGWTTDGTSWTVPQTAAAAGACWLMASLIGVVFLALVTGLQARRVATGMIVSSLVRAGIALFDGLAISLVFKPELKVFWSAFLGAGLLCLLFETVWAMTVSRRLADGAMKASPVA